MGTSTLDEGGLDQDGFFDTRDKERSISNGWRRARLKTARYCLWCDRLSRRPGDYLVTWASPPPLNQAILCRPCADVNKTVWRFLNDGHMIGSPYTYWASVFILLPESPEARALLLTFPLARRERFWDIALKSGLSIDWFHDREADYADTVSPWEKWLKDSEPLTTRIYSRPRFGT